jgi:hypothetical protein
MDFLGDDIIYRRVPSRSSVTDHETGDQRPSSDCFNDSSKPVPSPMSCISHRLLGDRTPESLCPGPGGDRLVAFSVDELTQLGLTVRADPTEDEPAHVLVEGDKSKRVRAALARMARFVV